MAHCQLQSFLPQLFLFFVQLDDQIQVFLASTTPFKVGWLEGGTFERQAESCSSFSSWVKEPYEAIQGAYVG